MTDAINKGLIERLEAASGPDRELDLEIWRLVDPMAAEVEAEGKQPLPWLHLYTASLDAAMTVPVPWQVRQMQLGAPTADDRSYGVQLFGGKVGGKRVSGFGANYALAYCAAALRAQAQEGK